MYHVPVLLQESVDGLNIKPGGVYVDATFGGGGHSGEILKRLSTESKLFAIDKDPDAQSNLLNDDRLHLIHGNFRFIKNYLQYYKLDKVDGILADFGVSSHQFDVSERGFSFRLGGELDMRMNKEQALTAADILNKYDEEKLYFIFKKYCDIQNPGRLVPAIMNYRQSNTYKGIHEFVASIEQAIPRNREHKYLAQVFQALRIEVNDEIGALHDFLNSCADILQSGGRISFISYHSLEDKPVKNLIRTGNTGGVETSDIFGHSASVFKPINRQVIIPSEHELSQNPRSRSAKLRIAEKI